MYTDAEIEENILAYINQVLGNHPVATDSSKMMLERLTKWIKLLSKRPKLFKTI